MSLFPSATLLVLMVLLAAGCELDNGGTNGGHVLAPGPIRSTLLSAEPAVLGPRFLPSPFCRTQPVFVTDLTLTVRSERVLFLGGVRFDFLDRFGAHSVPAVISSRSLKIPASTPVTIPGSSPIPIPGFVPFHGFRISSGRPLRESFSLQFDCGVPAAGTLFIVVDTTDERSIAETASTTVRVSQ